MQVQQRATTGSGRRIQVEQDAVAWIKRTPSRWFTTSVVVDGDALLVLTHRGDDVDVLWTPNRPVAVDQIRL